MKDKLMKISEARILIFLDQAIIERCFTRSIATKLKIDYKYILGLLAEMVDKSWLIKSEGGYNKKYYRINKRKLSKLVEARLILMKAR